MRRERKAFHIAFITISLVTHSLVNGSPFIVQPVKSQANFSGVSVGGFIFVFGATRGYGFVTPVPPSRSKITANLFVRIISTV